MSDTDDLVDALIPVVAALRELEILHFVGGSIASSRHRNGNGMTFHG